VAITWETTPAILWQAGTVYPPGSRVINPPTPYDLPNTYYASVGGTSDLYGVGPTGTDPNTPITDGTVLWLYIGAWTGAVVDVAPELASAPGANVMLAMAENMCADVNVWGSILDDGRRYLAAHFGQLARLRGKGMITAESVGPLSRSYATLMGPLMWNLTAAGRAYETLARSTSAIFGTVP
jgi:hypothetical protein